MPLLTSGDSAAIAADYLENSARMLVVEIDNWSARCDAGSLNAHSFLTEFLLQRLIVVRDRWLAARAVAGVATAIRSRFPGKFADDAAAETVLEDINDGMTALVNWIGTNVQASLTNASGYIEVMKLENNAVTYRQITSGASLAALKTQLQTLRSLLIG